MPESPQNEAPSDHGTDVDPAPPVLALVRDLIFASRICGSAEAFGVTVKVLRDPHRLRREPGSKLLVDLNLEGAIDAAVAWKGATGGAVVGFVSHTDVSTINRARAAGIDRVLARSAFVESLADVLTT